MQLGLAAITAAQFAVIYLPFLQAILGTQPVPQADGHLIVGVGAAFLRSSRKKNKSGWD